MGVYARFMRLHMALLQVLSGTSFWCSKCGDGGGLDDNDLLLVCDSKGCGQAHHLSSSSLKPMGKDFLAVRQVCTHGAGDKEAATRGKWSGCLGQP